MIPHQFISAPAIVIDIIDPLVINMSLKQLEFLFLTGPTLGVVEVEINEGRYLAVGQHAPQKKPSIHFYNMQTGELAHKVQLEGKYSCIVSVLPFPSQPGLSRFPGCCGQLWV